jgi:hypothetical protein
MRIRLQRCHLNILKRFFKPEHSHKAGKYYFYVSYGFLIDF